MGGGVRACSANSPDVLLLRYYCQQRAADAISSNMVKDELKRHSRMHKKLAEEQQVMQELYKVSSNSQPTRCLCCPALFLC
jgi:hypothetical protein